MKAKFTKPMAFLLVLVMLFALIPGMGALAADDVAENITDFSGTWDWDTEGYYDISWYNRTDTVFYISTNKQLAGLAWIVNQGNTLQLADETAPQQEFFTDKTIYLTADIYLNDHDVSGTSNDGTGDTSAHQWPSIAGGESTDSRNAVFDGTFDGQGHTVYNLYIYNLTSWGESAARNRGLFGVTAEAAVIENVTVENGFLRAARGVGAIVGKTGSLTGSYNNSRTGHGTLIENCHNVNTTIITTDSKGVGGISGSFWNYPIMRYCSNSGAISATGAYPAGGMAGESEGTIEYCVNTGTISSATNNAGGIVGSNKMTISAINSCYNTGTITGGYAGGIAGYQVGTSTSCYSIGSVSGTVAAKAAGAIFGEFSSTGTNNNLYYLTDSCASGIGKTTTGSADTAAKTADELKTVTTGESDILTLLGDAFIADFADANINNGYPILSWQENTVVPPTSDVSTVTVTTYPKRADVTVKDSEGTVIAANEDGTYDLADGTYTYTATMSGYKDTTGSFTVENGAPVDLETITLTADVDLSKFTDVNTSLWYKNAVEYSVANNLFTGTSATTWEPDTALSRAMFVTVLGKYSGVSNTDYATCEFDDVADGLWYTGYVQWAYDEGLVVGTGGGNFSPNASITRQEMAVIFYKYVAETGADMTLDGTKYSAFSDKDTTDSWAVTALTWATGKGIINGSDDGKLMPKETATRAQAAQIFMRIIEDIL